MTIRPRLRVAAFAATAGLLGAACAGGSSDSASEPRAAAVQADVAAPATDATPADSNVADTAGAAQATDAPAILQFTNAIIGGGELDASTLADKPTVFWFWSPN